MQNSKMERYYRSYVKAPARKSNYLKYSSLFVILTGLLLAVILMALLNQDGTADEAVAGFSTSTPINSIRADADNAATKTSDIVQSTPPTWQSIAVSRGDTLVDLLSNMNVNEQDTVALLATPNVKKALNNLQIGENLQVMLDDNNHLLGLRYPISDSKVLNVTDSNDGYKAQISTLPVRTKNIYANGLINNSLITSALGAGLSQKTAMQLASIFSSEVNFKSLHSGDSFQVIYQDKFNQKHNLGAGDILAARMNVGGHQYTAIGYTDSHGNISYYTPKGKALKGDFLRTPVKYVYVSSPFSKKRKHPILHYTRPHEGVDLAAYRGTPVKAAADGKIIFIGRDGGYGNLIKISHGDSITTRYGHLSRFVKGMHVGSHVTEGQRIAYVGSTGLATGPHLHFEVRIHGVPHNPLTVKLPSFGHALAAKDKKAFLAEAKPLLSELNQQQPSAKTLVNMDKAA